MPEDAIGIGGVDLADPATYLSGVPYDAFHRAPATCPTVAWHPTGRTGVSSPDGRRRDTGRFAGQRNVVLAGNRCVVRCPASRPSCHQLGLLI